MDDPDPAEQQKEHDDMEAGYDLSSVAGNFVYRNHFQYRAKLYVPKESSWRTNCHIGCFAKKGQINDYVIVDGDRELPAWTYSTQFSILSEPSLPRDARGPGRRKHTFRQQPCPNENGQKFGRIGRTSLSRKQHWVTDKLRLDIARKLR